MGYSLLGTRAIPVEQSFADPREGLAASQKAGSQKQEAGSPQAACYLLPAGLTIFVAPGRSVPGVR